MAEITVQVGGRDFRLACDAGREPRLKALAAEFDRRLGSLPKSGPSSDESQAFLVAALGVLEEYDEAKERWSSMTPEGQAAEWAAERLDRASERLEKLLAPR